MLDIVFTIYLPATTTQAQLNAIHSASATELNCRTNNSKKSVTLSLGPDHELFVPQDISN